ncbi:MAG: hypothetical protein LBC73_08445 [Oscillospiraceae bacterium]|nr:hypothetical protein [Oscillospiraceae bacterium]
MVFGVVNNMGVHIADIHAVVNTLVAEDKQVVVVALVADTQVGAELVVDTLVVVEQVGTPVAVVVSVVVFELQFHSLCKTLYLPVKQQNNLGIVIFVDFDSSK